LIPVARGNGVLLALSVPQGGMISGSSALLMLDGWTWEEMTLKAPVGLHVRWPDMTTFPASMEKEEKEKKQKAREKNLKALREALEDAQSYMTAKEAETKEGVPYHDVDVRWEAMIPVLKKEVPVFVHADEIKQIQAAIEFTNEHEVRMVLVGGQDAWRVTELLKQNDIAVIAGKIHDLPMRRFDAYDAPFALPAKLHQAGVPFCIAGPERTGNEGNLPFQAARAVAHGLPREEALRAITLYPAQILGVSDRVGSIEVGKDATLIVTDGDPLEIISQVEMEFIQGRRVDMGSRHKSLYEKYRQKYE
jgi:imidazolonepropionase-like amidohydrolase